MSTCDRCGLPEPLDTDVLHEGDLLCLSCSETCTCPEVRL